MCGIFGAISTRNESFINGDGLRAGCEALRHRGPDDEGIYLDEYAGLGMRRLSIIDIEGGKQPFSNEDRTLQIIFNGEIYNYREIRAQLRKKGHVFRSRSDTEVVLHAFEEYGPAFLHRLNGMYALAIWDCTNRRLFLARDRVGIKPLYYWSDGIRLVFASELRALITHAAVPREIDFIALDQYLTLEYIPSPRTIFQSVRKLRAGHYLTFGSDGVQIKEYWDIPVQPVRRFGPENIEDLKELMRDAVRCRLAADVPVGAFLSGGIDSSAIVALAQAEYSHPFRTYSIGFDDASYNELSDARAASGFFGTEHSDDILRPEIAELAEKLVRYMDEPIADFSIFPTYLVSQLARRDVKVVLTGDGGDEVFGGYDTYVANDMEKYYRRLPAFLRFNVLPDMADRIHPRPQKKGVVNKSKRFIEGASYQSSLHHVRWMIFMTDRDKDRLYSSNMKDIVGTTDTFHEFTRHFDRGSSFNDLSQLQYVDLKTYLVDNILTKVDRMSMAASLEARIPLLDHRIVEYMLNVPREQKICRGKTKLLLRDVMKNVVPDFVLSKPKTGFSSPIKQWLRGPIAPLMKDILSTTSIRRQGYFDPACVATWITEHEQSIVNHSHRLWALTVLGMWLKSLHQ